MARVIDLPERPGLDQYEAVAHLAPAVRELRHEAEAVVGALDGRTVWMVNSTETGGGVAEMLPTMITLLRELGVACEWIVVESDDMDFFALTKHLHNLIHGAGSPELTPQDRELYEKVNRENADEMAEWVQDGDVLVVHDPQPMATAGMLIEEKDLSTVWRCHIGLDESNAATDAAWDFLRPFAEAYGRGVFSAPEYVPGYFRDRSTLIYPAIDPLSQKNRELALHKQVGVLANSALVVPNSPILTPMYRHVAERLQLYGEFAPANVSEDIGLLTRPIVTQISRWDALKGWEPLLEAFVRLKEHSRRTSGRGDVVHDRRMELVRLVLAGPDPASVADDPEGKEVLDRLCRRYTELPPHVQRDVALIALPMDDVEQNALMVNALQRASSIVAQNSLREGFGLTVTEGMWKRVPILTNRKACGPRQQVRHRVDGCLIDDPGDPDELCSALDDMLASPTERKGWGRNAQRHVHDKFLVFAQLSSWLSELHRMVE